MHCCFSDIVVYCFSDTVVYCFRYNLACTAVSVTLWFIVSGIISGALLQLQDTWSLGCTQREFVVSSMLIGAVIGSLFGGTNLMIFNPCACPVHMWSDKFYIIHEIE